MKDLVLLLLLTNLIQQDFIQDSGEQRAHLSRWSHPRPDSTCTVTVTQQRTRCGYICAELLVYWFMFFLYE